MEGGASSAVFPASPLAAKFFSRPSRQKLGEMEGRPSVVKAFSPGGRRSFGGRKKAFHRTNKLARKCAGDVSLRPVNEECFATPPAKRAGKTLDTAACWKKRNAKNFSPGLAGVDRKPLPLRPCRWVRKKRREAGSEEILKKILLSLHGKQSHRTFAAALEARR